MKVYVQVIDTMTGIYQTGMIEEPVKKGFELQNALKHFGVIFGEVTWLKVTQSLYYGTIENKVVIAYESV